MARRTREEMLGELRRLGAIYDAWRDYQIAHGSPEMRDVVSRSTRSIEDNLVLLRPGGPRLSDLLQGYQQAINDISEATGHAMEDGQPGGRDFLAFYQERTGRDWWTDAGDTTKMGRAILKRGRIRNETEWYLLANLLAPADQAVFSAEEVERLDAMRRRFEETERR